MVRPTDPRQPTPPTKPIGSRKVTRELLGLGAVAVLAVYSVGYAQTNSVYQQLSAQQAQAAPRPSSVATAPPAAPTLAPSPTPSVDPTITATPSAASDEASTPAVLASTPIVAPPTATAIAPTPVPPTATPVASSRYKDGTYSGYGSGRHGSIQVAVVIKSGKIASTSVTRCGTRYPCSAIADLPGEVISAQSTNVDTVSGATDSSDSFLEAVDQALQQASGPA
jgi:uncharacterized protein with FMN-binding domain